MKLRWVKNTKHVESIWDCLNEDDRRMAFISLQPGYSNRGHFMGMVEIGGIDSDDGWPNYYMRLDRAQDEILAFLEWRLGKIRCIQPHGGETLPRDERLDRDLLLYGQAFEDITVGRILDPNAIVVHGAPGPKIEKPAEPVPFVHYDTADGRCGLCGRQDCGGNCFK
jgi:hypothetical protein